MTRKYYPVLLDLQNKPCLVIGGGVVAKRKILSLIQCNAIVKVISEELCEELTLLYKQGSINWLRRNYREGDIENALLVFASTDNQIVNMQICNEAKQKGIRVNVVDIPEEGDFIVPSKLESGDLTIAISTNGKSPALAKKSKRTSKKLMGLNLPPILTYWETIGIWL
jgi:precorrin-2 dehydrogenase / sirohydrochlorin ferrochelatase